MSPEKSLALLRARLERISELANSNREDPEFKKWHRDTEVAIEKIFGKQTRNIKDFKRIDFTPGVFFPNQPRSDFIDAFKSGLKEASAILRSMIDEIEEYSSDEDGTAQPSDNVSIIKNLCIRFHQVARQLRARHAERPTLEIEDEYDVQDLMHALLKLSFDDVRAEEWTPSYAGASSRMDFLLKEQKIVIEIKKTRKSLTPKSLGEELLVDRERYAAHPDCKTLICFVYDPEGRIGNPIGLERDLEQNSGDLEVCVIVAPKA